MMTNSFYRSSIRGLPATAALLWMVLLFSGCRRHDRESQVRTQVLPTMPVQVITLAPQTEVVTEEYVGTVQPRLRASLEARTTARVVQYLAVPGQPVKQGQLLVDLDSRDLQARRDQSAAVRDLASKELQRLRALIGQKAIAQSDLDTAESRLQVAEASLKEAETLLSHVRVLAPFDGVITRKRADTGDLATPGRVVVEMENPHSLRVEVSLPESLLSRTRTEQALQIRFNPQGTHQFLTASIAEVEPAADPVTRTFRVRLDLPAESGLRSGQFVRVLVPTHTRQVLRIPPSAVQSRGQLETVFLVQDRTAKLRLIRTDSITGSDLQVLAGLSSGELLILRPPSSLRDGQPVQEQP